MIMLGRKSGSAFQRKQPGGAVSSTSRTSVQASGLRDWCHTFDLSRPMVPDSTAESHLVSAPTYVYKYCKHVTKY